MSGAPSRPAAALSYFATDQSLPVADFARAAAERGFEIIDIRSAAEVAAHPAAARHIPMHELLANPRLLAGRQALLVCATGKRSLAAAQALRKQGLAVRSLAGGLQKLERSGAIQQ